MHGYRLHNHQLLLFPFNCLISHTFIEVFLFLMSKMSNTFARCWTGTDLLLFLFGVYPFYFGKYSFGIHSTWCSGKPPRLVLCSTFQHQPKRIAAELPPSKKKNCWGNVGQNTHTGENCWFLEHQPPFLGEHKTMNEWKVNSHWQHLCAKPTVRHMLPICALVSIKPCCLFAY